MFKNLSLGGILLDKIKKSVSMFLALLMIMSAFPMAGATLYNSDGSAYVEGTDYSYGKHTITNPTELWCDTTETTEILRLAAGYSDAALYQYGNYVVSATKSGIPDCGSYGFYKYMYAGETPSAPQIVCKVYGVSDVNQITNPKIFSTTGLTPTLLSEVATKTVGNDQDGKGDYVKLTWTYTLGNSSKCECTTGANTNVVYTIQFTTGGKTFTEYAYAHTEYILHPNGFATYARKFASEDKYKARMSVVGTLVGANMKPGFAADWASNYTTRTYVNNSDIAKTDDDGNYGLQGMTESGPDTSGFLREASDGNSSENNSIVYTLQNAPNNWFTGEWTSPSSCYFFNTYSRTATDGNRTLTTVWVDKGTDYLGSYGFSTSGKTNNLNMRMTYKVGTQRLFYYAYLWQFQLRNGNYNNGGQSSSSFTRSNWDTDGDITNVNSGQWTANTSGKSISNSSDKVQSVVDAGVKDDGNGGYINDEAVNLDGAYAQAYLMVEMGGTGPTVSQENASDCWSIAWEMRGRGKNQDPSNVMSTSNWNSGVRTQVSNIMSVRFRVYDTTNLRKLITAIDSGTAGKSVTSFAYGGQYNSGVAANTVSVSVNKGMNPQEPMYTSDTWSAFKSAYDTAREYIAAFDLNMDHSYTGCTTLSKGAEQTEIDNALVALANAYNNLEYQESGKITIRHVLKSDPTVEVAPTEVYYGFNSDGSLSTSTTPDVKFKTGATFTLRSLSNLRGYKVDGLDAVEGVAKFVKSDSDATYGSTVLYDKNGKSIYEEGDNDNSVYTFYYVPKENALNIYTNNSNVDVVVNRSVKTGEQPDFTSIRTDLGSKAHYNYAGLYTDDKLTGTAINEATWTMPNDDTNLYVKWSPRPVKLHINAVDETGTAVALSSGEYGTAVTPEEADGEIQKVTLTEPTAPTSIKEGYTFITFYSDAECTNKIEWPISADYSSTDYKIVETEGTGDNIENTIEIYAQFKNTNNIINFDPDGGTIPATYTNITNNQLKFTLNEDTGKSDAISYPVPTRAGYTFKGWVDKDGNPIDSTNVENIDSGAWTTKDGTTGEYSPVTDGTIVMKSTVGFVAYAEWTPNDITAKINLGFTPTSSMDSTADEYPSFTVKADQVSSKDDEPAAPRRYGYTFQYWRQGSARFTFGTSKYPTSDFTITAVWAEASSTAFADLTSYVKHAGKEYVVDEQHSKARTAAKGDVVSIKFSVSGDFYSGAQSYIFGYNTDLYEEIAGINIFEANEDNTYIKGICAELTTVTQFSSAVTSAFTNTDPVTGGKNVKYVEVAIDPDIGSMESYEAQYFGDTNYLIEIRLKVKDSPAVTKGSVWLATETLRTADNIWGDTSISYISKKDTNKSLRYVSTTTVDFDQTPIVSTVEIDPELTYQDYTITLTLPKDGDTVLGVFADGTTADKTYTGRDGAEILETYTDADGDDAYGFPTPTREGYTIEKWVCVKSDGTLDENDTWEPGYYATEDQNGKTYQPVWKANQHTYTFYKSNGTTVYKSVTVYYDYSGTDLTSLIPTTSAETNKEFIGWIEKGKEATEGNTFNFTTDVVKGDKEFYAYVLNERQTIKLNYYLAQSDGTTSATTIVSQVELTTAQQDSYGLEKFRTGDVINVVKDIPADADRVDGVKYLTYDQYKKIGGSTLDNYVPLDPQDTPTLTVVKPGRTDKTANQLSAYFVGKEVTITFTTIGSKNPTVKTSNGTKYVGATYNGTCEYTTAENDNKVTVYTWTVKGHYNEKYTFSDYTAGVTAPFGFTIKSWSGTSQGTFKDGKYSPNYNTKEVTLQYVNTDGTAFDMEELGADLDYMSCYYNSECIPTSDFETVIGSCTVTAGYEIDGFVPVIYNSETGKYEHVGETVYSKGSDLYMGDIAENEFTADADGELTICLMAHQSPKKIKVEYKVAYADGAASAVALGDPQEIVFNSTYTVGNGITIADVPTGYALRQVNGKTAWYTTDDFSDTAVENGTTATMTTDGTLTYYAVYDPVDCTVTFNANGGAFADGNTTKADTIKFNAQIAASETPTWEGHTFKGWAETADATAPLETLPVLKSTEGATYYAVWTYSITFNANGGKFANGETSITAEYLPGATVSAPETPTMEGYTFDSWDGTVVTEMPAENLTYNAKWNVNSYTVYFGTDGTYGIITANYGEDITARYDEICSNTKKDGYVLTGWLPNDCLVKVDSKLTMPAIDGGKATLEPVFEAIKYNITFDHNGGSGEATTINDVAYDAVFDAPELYPLSEGKEGYTFAGWSKNKEATEADYGKGTDARNVNLTTVSGETVILYAVWDADEYTLTFKANNGKFSDGSDEKEIKADYNSDITAKISEIASDNITRTGYKFLGWSTMADAKTSSIDITEELKTMPLGSKIYYAVWEKQSYKLTIADAGSDSAEKDVPYGDTIADVLPAAPTKDGYDFAASWVLTDENGNVYDGTTMPDYALTATAQWNAHVYTVNYNFGGAVVTSTTKQTEEVTYAPGVTVTLPESGFNKTDYRFTGWYASQEDADSKTNPIDAEGTGVYAIAPQSANGAIITLYAGWEEDSYTLTFDPNGGAFADDLTGVTKDDSGNVIYTVIYNYTISTYGNGIEPTKVGYDFAGWYTSDNQTPSQVMTMPQSNLTFKAKWTEHEYTDGVKFVQPDAVADDYTGNLTYANKTAYTKADGNTWTVTVKTGETLSAYPETTPAVSGWTFMYWLASDTAPEYKYNAATNDFYCDDSGAKYTLSGTYTDKNGDELNVTKLSDFTMPAIEGDTLYLYPVYYRDDVALAIKSTSQAGIVDDPNEELDITGYIYNVGRMQKKSGIKSQLEVEGDGSLKLTPSKDNIYGTGAKVELVDNRKGATTESKTIETYYIIVFGDVTGTARLQSTDISIVEQMVEIEDSEARTWYIKNSVDSFQTEDLVLRECFERAADADNDGDVDAADAKLLQDVSFDEYEVTFVPTTGDTKGHYELKAYEI